MDISATIFFLVILVVLAGILTYSSIGALKFGVIYIPGKHSLSRVTIKDSPFFFFIALMMEIGLSVYLWIIFMKSAYAILLLVVALL